MSFANKVVLVTGGGSGIGAATALLFAKKSASVAIVGRNEAKLHAVSEQCKTFGKKPLSIQADLANDDNVRDIIKNVINRYGKLDVLVNNAGITAVSSILKGNLLEEYDRIMRVNLRAPIYLTTLAAPYLIESKGNVVNVSSVSGVSYFRRPTVMPYAISKVGLDHFTRGAALEFIKSEVRVNAIRPALTRTSIWESGGIDKSWEHGRNVYDLPRVSEPEEIADLICYLASDKAKSITGVTYDIDNGAIVLGG